MAVNTTYPMSGSILFEKETSYKAGIADSAPKRISDAVSVVRIGTGDMVQDLYDIGSVEVSAFQTTMVDPVLHIEFFLQPSSASDILHYATDRVDCDLESVAIQAAFNECSSASAGYFICWGCVCKSYTVSAAQGEMWKVAMDFSVASLQVSTTSYTSAAPAALGTPFASFNIAGGLTWAGVTGAYVTNGFSFTVDNGVKDLYNMGSQEKQAAIAGKLSITGTCDISMDKGGYTNFNEVLNQTPITSLILNTGLTASGGAGKFTLSTGSFMSTEIEGNTSGEAVISSVPFKFKSIAIAAGT